MTDDTTTKTTLGQLGNLVQALQCADDQNVYGLLVTFGKYFTTIGVHCYTPEGEKFIKQWIGHDIEVGVLEVSQAIAEKL